MFPIYPNLKYEGPVRIAGINLDREEGHNNNIRGQETEIKVIEAISSQSELRKLGLKIFHGVQVTNAKMEAFCDIYQKLCRTTLSGDLSSSGGMIVLC